MRYGTDRRLGAERARAPGARGEAGGECSTRGVPGLRTLVPVVLAMLVVSGSTVGLPARAPPPAPAPAPSGTVWLCRPGQADDPCTADLNTTEVTANGSTKVEDVAPAASTEFDCFYVYPTVSNGVGEQRQPGRPCGRDRAAVAQASRFSQVCRVWAPMYRQRTSTSEAQGLGSDPAADQVAYESLLSGWEDYLAHDNDGRPIIFIGHSQGAAMLIRLLHNEIDPIPALRARMVSAIILGGNVQVPMGKDVGGSFRHIPTCGSPRADRMRDRLLDLRVPSAGVGTLRPAGPGGQPAVGADHLVGPAGGVRQSGGLLVTVGAHSSRTSSSATSLVPGVDVTTPWVTYPGLYTAQCKSRGGATWLQVSATAVKGDPRPTVSASLGPDWGYHLDDVNLALGNLVRRGPQEAAYRG